MFASWMYVWLRNRFVFGCCFQFFVPEDRRELDASRIFEAAAHRRQDACGLVAITAADRGAFFFGLVFFPATHRGVGSGSDVALPAGHRGVFPAGGAEPAAGDRGEFAFGVVRNADEEGVGGQCLVVAPADDGPIAGVPIFGADQQVVGAGLSETDHPLRVPAAPLARSTPWRRRSARVLKRPGTRPGTGAIWVQWAGRTTTGWWMRFPSSANSRRSRSPCSPAVARAV